VWKDGATGGYASYVGCSMRTKVGVVLLANTRASRITFPFGRIHHADDGHEKTEIFPLNETYSFARDVTAYVAFDPTSNGSASSLMLYMGGRLKRAIRVH
jgi:hypothetical protein